MKNLKLFIFLISAILLSTLSSGSAAAFVPYESIQAIITAGPGFTWELSENSPVQFGEIHPIGASGNIVYFSARAVKPNVLDYIFAADISSPNHPRRLTNGVPGKYGAVFGDYLYVSRPEQPVAIYMLDKAANTLELVGEMDIYSNGLVRAGNYLVVMNYPKTSFFTVVDPIQPVLYYEIEREYPYPSFVVGEKFLYISELELVFDFSAPTIKSFDLTTYTSGRLGAISGNYLYVPNTTERGLYVYDLAHPERGRVGQLMEVYMEHGLAIKGSTGYSCTGNGKLLVLDISAPESPKVHRETQTPCGGFISNLNRLMIHGEVLISGQYTFDISKPKAPMALGSASFGKNYTSFVKDNDLIYAFDATMVDVFSVKSANQWIWLNSYPYAADLQSAPKNFRAAAANGHLFIVEGFYSNTFLMVYDLKEPGWPGMTNRTELYSANPIDRGIFTYNNKAYVKIGSELVIFDITNPRALTEISRTGLYGIPLVLSNGWLYTMSEYSTMAYNLNTSPLDLSSSYSSGSISMGYGMNGSAAAIGSVIYIASYGNVSAWNAGTQGGFVNIPMPQIKATRLVISGNYLLAFDSYSLNVLDITKPMQPKWVGALPGPWPVGPALTIQDHVLLSGESTILDFKPLAIKSATFPAANIDQTVKIDDFISYSMTWCNGNLDTLLVQDDESPLPPLPGQDWVAFTNLHRPTIIDNELLRVWINPCDTMRVEAKLQFPMLEIAPQGIITQTLGLYMYNAGGWELKDPAETPEDVVFSTEIEGQERWAILAQAHPAPPPSGHHLFLPFMTMVDPNAKGDIVIDRLEITQITNTPQGDMPLVAGKPSILRVYAHSGNNIPADNTFVTIQATTNQGVQLPGSPWKAGAWTIFKNASPWKTGFSLNFSLPDAWQQAGNIQITVTLECRGSFVDLNPTNNSMGQSFTFTPISSLGITYVPIRYKNIVDGYIFPSPAPIDISQDLQAMYPIPGFNITWHPEYFFAGNLYEPDYWISLLNQMVTLKKLDKIPASSVAYGLVPRSDGAGRIVNSYVAGIGKIGTRASVGFEREPIVFAHEIGHNFGLYHAPCGNVGGADPNYPYPGGAIGQPGFSGNLREMYEPWAFADLMSYCEPVWLSDYTYRKLYMDQLRYSTTAAQDVRPASQVLYLRALDTEKQSVIYPVYKLEASPFQGVEPGRYHFVLLNAAGKVIEVIPAQAGEIPDEENQGTAGVFLEAMIEVPNLAVAEVQLVRDNKVISISSLPANASGTAIQAVSIQADGKTLSIGLAQENHPAWIQISNDNGETWHTIAIDWTDGPLTWDTSLSNTSLQPGTIFRVQFAGVEGYEQFLTIP